MYVVESGSGLNPMQLATPRIPRVEDGRAIEVVSLLPGEGVQNAAVAIGWDDGAWYFTHRDAEAGTDAVLACDDGWRGDARYSVASSTARPVRPDGRKYVAVGAAGNSGVMGPGFEGMVKRHPEVHTTTCHDLVLTGRNFLSPNFRTDEPHDMVLTGAFVPFGTETTSGQV